MRCARAVSFALVVCGLATASAAQAPADQAYLLPPKAIVDILDQPGPPEVVLSPARDVVAVLEHAPMPTIAELSRPMLRLAGLRIDPATNGRHRVRTARSLTLKSVADGAVRQVTLPAAPALTWIGFSPDGARFAFTQTTRAGIELWIGEAATGHATAMPGANLNAVLTTPCAWVGMGGSLVCADHVPGRGAGSGRAGGADRAQRAGTPRRHVAGAHLSGPAHLGARRSALRVLRQQPARDRCRGHRRAHAARASRAARASAALARWAVPRRSRG